MHIMEGFLLWQWCLPWWIIALPGLVFGVYQPKKVLDNDREALPLLGVTGGFIFILSSVKLPSVTGSCSHPTGTGLSAISFGLRITAVVCAIVLLFQSLFLAHGGLSVLGANIVSMGIVGLLVGYALYRLLHDTSVNRYLRAGKLKPACLHFRAAVGGIFVGGVSGYWIGLKKNA